jgi:hypothetical protein
MFSSERHLLNIGLFQKRFESEIENRIHTRVSDSNSFLTLEKTNIVQRIRGLKHEIDHNREVTEIKCREEHRQAAKTMKRRIERIRNKFSVYKQNTEHLIATNVRMAKSDMMLYFTRDQSEGSKDIMLDFKARQSELEHEMNFAELQRLTERLKHSLVVIKGQFDRRFGEVVQEQASQIMHFSSLLALNSNKQEELVRQRRSSESLTKQMIAVRHNKHLKGVELAALQAQLNKTLHGRRRLAQWRGEQQSKFGELRRQAKELERFRPADIQELEHALVELQSLDTAVEHSAELDRQEFDLEQQQQEALSGLQELHQSLLDRKASLAGLIDEREQAYVKSASFASALALRKPCEEEPEQHWDKVSFQAVIRKHERLCEDIERENWVLRERMGSRITYQDVGDIAGEDKNILAGLPDLSYLKGIFLDDRATVMYRSVYAKDPAILSMAPKRPPVGNGAAVAKANRARGSDANQWRQEFQEGIVLRNESPPRSLASSYSLPASPSPPHRDIESNAGALQHRLEEYEGKEEEAETREKEETREEEEEEEVEAKLGVVMQPVGHEGHSVVVTVGGSSRTSRAEAATSLLSQLAPRPPSSRHSNRPASSSSKPSSTSRALQREDQDAGSMPLGTQTAVVTTASAASRLPSRGVLGSAGLAHGALTVATAKGSHSAQDSPAVLLVDSDVRAAGVKGSTTPASARSAKLQLARGQQNVLERKLSVLSRTRLAQNIADDSLSSMVRQQLQQKQAVVKNRFSGAWPVKESSDTPVFATTPLFSGPNTGTNSRTNSRHANSLGSYAVKESVQPNLFISGTLTQR